MTPHMVVIEWEDSAQAAPQWQWLANLEAPPILKCRSIGFLVRDTDKEKSLAVSITVDGDTAEQASGVISIPTRSIVRIERIKEQPHD
jgi:hypothetical protein